MTIKRIENHAFTKNHKVQSIFFANGTEIRTTIKNGKISTAIIARNGNVQIFATK